MKAAVLANNPDMNQDQRLDVVVGYSQGVSSIFMNEGTGSLYQEIPFGDGSGAVYGIAIGDLNADGRNDVVQARSEATNAVFFQLGTNQELDQPSTNDKQWLTYSGGDGPGKGKRIVLIAAEQEYRSEQSMPMMAKILSTHHGFDCTVLFAVNDKGDVDPTLPVYPEKGKEASKSLLNAPLSAQKAPSKLMSHCANLNL